MKAQTILLLALTLFFSAYHLSISQNLLSSNFCSRVSNSHSCPTPPTFDTIDIQSYLGKWYEIGSTASFKLLTEAGLVCDQANYSFSGSSKVALINSGVRVIGALASAEVAAISLSARGVCSNARHICTTLAQSGGIGEAIQQISDVKENIIVSNPEAAATIRNVLGELTSSLNDANQAVEAVANDLNYIQILNGEISQGNATLTESVDAIHNSVDTANVQQTLIEALVKNLETAEMQILQVSEIVSGPESEELQQAVKSMEKGGKKLWGDISAMRVGLEAIQVGASTLRLDGQPIHNGKVSSVKGEAEQNMSFSGKLEVSINGVRAPYWIVSVDGEASEGYKAALIFSCTENKVVGVSKSLFILSRTPELSKEVVSRFLLFAESYGIFTDCDDPFLFTVQKGGDCGRPPSTSSPYNASTP